MSDGDWIPFAMPVKATFLSKTPGDSHPTFLLAWRIVPEESVAMRKELEFMTQYGGIYGHANILISREETK